MLMNIKKPHKGVTIMDQTQEFILKNKLHAQNKELATLKKKYSELKNTMDKIKFTVKLADKWCYDQSNGLGNGIICMSAMKDIRRFIK